MEEPEIPSQSTKSKPNWVKYIGLGFQLVVSIFVFVAAGYYLDQHFETQKPWFTLSFSLVGCVASLAQMVYKFLKENK